MLDLSRASLEYVCKHVTSPNIARRFGHKLDQKDQKEECIGTLQVTTTYKSSRHTHGVPTIATLPEVVPCYLQGLASYGSGATSYGQGGYWCRSSKSSSRDMEASVSTTPGQTGLAARKENLPGMFSFHQNSAKAYLRTSI